MSPSPPRRTPKSGILRKWILLPERKKLVIVAVLAVIGFWGFRSLFFAAPQHEYSVSHSLTQDEKVALEAKIRQRLQAAHEAELERMEEATREQLDILRDMVTQEMAKKQADEQVIAALKQNMTALTTETEAKKETLKAQFLDNLDGVLGSELAKAQKEIIESRADEMLTWFCSLDLDNDELPTPVTEQVIDLGEQPCIGVASEGDPPVPVRRYSVSSPDIARTVATQAMQSLKNRTGAEGNAVYSFTKLATSQYDPRVEDRCCDSFVFGVHPVFGVFYKIRLPLSDVDPGAGEGDSHFTRSVCFRRKFHPKPKVKPLTSASKVDHLVHPESLAVPTKPAGRRLKSSAPTFAPGTVHVILPFRAQRLDIFPSLIKNFGRIKQVNEGREATPFRIIVAPVSWEYDTPDFDAKARMEKMITAASASLGISITLAEPIPDEDMTKEKVVDLVKPWIDTSKKLLKNIKLSENADPVASGVLPNPWLAAVAGALKLVPTSRAPVLILDSATYSLPNNLIKKTLWRIVNGRMIYSPISSAVAFPIEAGYLLSDGGVSKTDDDLEETGETATYGDEDWWSDVEDINRFMEFEEEGVEEEAAGDTRRRALRSTASSSTTSPDALRSARKALQNRGRRLLEAEDEAAPAAEQDDATNMGFEEDDEYYLGDQNPYGDSLEEYLTDFADDQNEWGHWDPELLESDFAYGVGGESAGDGAGNNYFFDQDSYDSYDHYYEDIGEDDTELLQKRVTTLGATKSDIASMIFRVLETKPSASAERIATPQADNCIMLRMVAGAHRNRYRVVRTVVPGLYVDTAEFALGAGDPEVYPCECDYDSKARHCRLVLSQTEVDDPIDESRVNCVLTSMMSKSEQGGVTKAHEGASHDLDIAKLVRVTHAVRFFKPSKGVEIIAKVLKADDSKRRRLGGTSAAVGPEVFAFQWHLSNSIRTVDDIEP